MVTLKSFESGGSGTNHLGPDWGNEQARKREGF